MPKMYFIRRPFCFRRTQFFSSLLAAGQMALLCVVCCGPERLRAEEEPPLPDAPSSPRTAVAVSEAAYTVAANRSRLTMTALLRLHTPAGARTGLTLRLGNGSLESARMGRRPVLLRKVAGTENAENMVVVFPAQQEGAQREGAQQEGAQQDDAQKEGARQRDDSLLELVISTEWRFAGRDRVATVSLPVQAPAVMRFPVAAGERLLVNGAVLKRAAPLEEEAVYEFPVGNRRQVELRLISKGARHTADVLRRARSRIELAVEPHIVRWKSETHLL